MPVDVSAVPNSLSAFRNELGDKRAVDGGNPYYRVGCQPFNAYKSRITRLDGVGIGHHVRDNGGGGRRFTAIRDDAISGAKKHLAVAVDGYLAYGIVQKRAVICVEIVYCRDFVPKGNQRGARLEAEPHSVGAISGH